MADDEVAVGQLKVERGGAEHDAGQAADQEHRQEAEGEQHRRGEANPPAVHRGQPVEELDAGRNRDQKRGHGEEQIERAAHADAEHVMGPDAQADEGDGHRRRGHELVAEQHLAREDGNHFRDHAEHRQDQDVDLGMAEEPEQVLPQIRRAAVGHVEEMGAELAIEQDHDQRRGQRRDRQQHLDRRPEHRPDEERHLAQRHARGAHAEDRGDEIDARR